MVKKLSIVGIAVLLIILAILNRATLERNTHAIFYDSSCNTPIQYRIGKIDSRFGITEEKLKDDITQAGNIWSHKIGKQLFEYDDKARLVFNLEYDRRQGLNSQISDLDNGLKEKNQELEPQIEAYQARGNAFEKNIAQLNADILYWNAQGGAPAAEYEKLKSRQAELQKEADALNALGKELNQSTSQYNTKVKELNKTVKDFNEALADKPEEGLYTQDGLDSEIAIYFVNTQEEIIHTLAHEMGHALGIDHNNNPESIMYPKTNDVTVPSPEDQESLKSVCAEQSRVKLIAIKGAYLVHDVLKRVKN